MPSGTLRVGRTGKAVTVGVDKVLIGRDASCDLAIDDPEVSAIHAEVFVEDCPAGRRIVVRDCESLNGMFVHGVPVRELVLAKPTTFMVATTKIEFVLGTPKEVALTKREDFHGLVGADPKMRKVMDRAQKIAPTELSVLILGETGSGREVVARAIHAASPRASEPFVVVDCGSIPAALAESMLFGHERGAFTGAIDRSISPFLRAGRGTVFLDEFGELPLELQPKLLRALAERTVQSVGGTAPKRFEARIVAATRRDLPTESNEGKFRSDLYFRVAEITIELPPLRKRLADIPLLMKSILDDMGLIDAFDRISDQSMDWAMRHDWPGNVRELRNVVRAAVGLADEEGPIELFVHPSKGEGPGEGERAVGSSTQGDPRYTVMEKAYFRALHDEHRGNRSAMARASGLKRDTILKKLRRYAIGMGEK